MTHIDKAMGIFLCKYQLYSFSDTLEDSFLDVFFLMFTLILSELHVNPRMKDSFSEKGNKICVNGKSFSTARSPFYVILCCYFRLLASLSQVTYLLNAIQFLSLSSSSINKLKHQLLFICKNFMFSNFMQNRVFPPGNGGEMGAVSPLPLFSLRPCKDFVLITKYIKFLLMLIFENPDSMCSGSIKAKFQ